MIKVDLKDLEWDFSNGDEIKCVGKSIELTIDLKTLKDLMESYNENWEDEDQFYQNPFLILTYQIIKTNKDMNPETIERIEGLIDLRDLDLFKNALENITNY